MKGRKRNIVIAFALVVGLLLTVPTLTHGAFQPAVGDNIVRIHLNSYGDPASVTMNAAGSYSIQDNDKAVSGVFTVAADGAGIKITTGSTTYNLGSDVYIKAGSLSVSNLIQINNGYRYAGDMRIINTGGKLKLINHVDIETYVMGVLPYEMGNNWPTEALKAQAVAARSFVYFIMHSKTRTAVEQDLVNSTSHQIYNGYNASYTNCIAAVNATKNTIMKTPDGKLVFACYSASNGGLTESGAASGATSADYDYLPFRSDPYDLAFALGASAYSGKLTIPKKLAAEDLKTRETQPYKMLREKLQAAGVDTNTFSGDISVKSIALRNPKAANPERQFTGAEIVLGIPGSADVTLSFGPVTVGGSSTNYPFLNEILGLKDKFSMLMLREDATSWLLASVRNGHGAGLSQIGAYQMAAEGKAYQDILAFYFNLGSAANLVTMPWDTSGGTDPGAGGYTVTPVNKTGTVNTPGTTLNVRSGPATGNDIVLSLKDGTKVKITGQVADWWRIDIGSGKSGFVNGAFIKLDPDSKQPVTDSATTEKPANPQTSDQNQTKTGKVNTPGASLNVRSGMGTSYTIIGSLKHGENVTVTTTENSSWYKLNYNGKTGYVSAAYIVLDGTSPTQGNSQTKTVYVNTPGLTLNIRSGPGTSFSIIGSLKHGEKISVTDENSEWFKLTYNGKTGYVNKAFTKADNPVPSPVDPTDPKTQQPRTVYVNTPGSTLNVRSGPGLNYPVTGSLVHGEKIMVTDENSSWCKLTYSGKTGYISSSYVKTTETVSPQPSQPASKTGTVNAPAGLNVREGPGANYKVLGVLVYGMKVTILDQSGSWYKIEYGTKEAWVSTEFVKL